MLQPGAQEWFYREIQRAFREGVSPDVLLSVLSRYLLVALSVIAAFLLWRHGALLLFHLRRIKNGRLRAEMRNRIGVFLRDRNVPIGIYLVGAHTRQFVGTGVLLGLDNRGLTLRLTSDVPVTLRRILRGRRIICFFKPLRVGGKRVNSFSTYVRGSQAEEGLIRTLEAYSPDAFTTIPRRRHVRLRIRRSGAVRLKLWTEDKKHRLQVAPPDYESAEEGADVGGWKPTAEALDISPGGMKIQLRPQRNSPSLRVGEEVVLELQVLDPARKVFHVFLLLAGVRNIMRPGGGLVAVGVQFRALGERVASRSTTWRAVGDEGVEPLKELLERMRAPRSAPSGGPGEPAS